MKKAFLKFSLDVGGWHLHEASCETVIKIDFEGLREMVGG
jgi:hypothetical protein